jgi:hypothetical protein
MHGASPGAWAGLSRRAATPTRVIRRRGRGAVLDMVRLSPSPPLAPLTDSPTMLPEDAALYVCDCGSAFTASVTTSVICPTCGHRQPW